MPAIFTHIQFGKEVAATLPPALQSLTKAHPQAFYLGTQGPDILFYHKPLKKKNNPARKKGWDLHAEAPEAFFLRAAELILAETENFDGERFAPKSAQAAYLLGFLCHFTLDCTCHPYIDENSVNGLTHGKIESELDKYQFRKIGRKPRGFNAATLFTPSEEAQAASASVLGVNEENTALAMRTMRKINGLFSHKCGIVHGLCHFVLTLAGMNKTFGEMFIHKKDDGRCQALLPVLGEKFNQALLLASAVIVDFFENLPSFVQKGSLENNFYRFDYSGNQQEEAR